MPYCIDYTLRKRQSKGKLRNRYHKKIPAAEAAGMEFRTGKYW